LAQVFWFQKAFQNVKQWRPIVECFEFSWFRFDELELILRSGRQVRLLCLRSKRGAPSRLSSRKRSVFVYSRHLDMFCWIDATNCTGPAQQLGCKVDIEMLSMQPWDISPTYSSHYFRVTCNLDLWGKMMSKTRQSRLSATLHLSVVPRSAVSHGKERHLVAAIQFAATMDSWQSKGSAFVMMSSGRWCAQRCSQHLKVIET
jgi:hypothetical protein